VGKKTPLILDEGPAPRQLPKLSALRQLEAPQAPVVLARWLCRGLLALALLVSVLPWQQTSYGSGRVIAWAPADRQQAVDAPINGVVDRWYVREGEKVKAGDPLVDLRDNDPALLSRLQAERATLVDRQTAAEAKAEAYTAKVEAMRAARDASVSSAEAKTRLEEQELGGAREKRTGDAAGLEAARLNLARTTTLYEKGLKSKFDLEQAQLRYDTARATLAQSEAKVIAAQNKLQGARLDRDKAAQEGDGKVLESEGLLQEALSGTAAAQARILDIDVEIARQQAQTVRAPRDGTVFQIFGGQGGEQTKAGDKLLVLVPDTESRAVELRVDGNDVPMLSKGQPVRMQFEGWPAIQFSGWPSVAVGTFGGRVTFVDAAGDGSGQFRILVEADPADAPWPEARFLRQGVLTKGWVLLAQVPVAYEIWRQLNNFPPSVDKPPEDGKASKGDSVNDKPKKEKDDEGGK
jgi:adhesin transport system membrane fusion protein